MSGTAALEQERLLDRLLRRNVLLNLAGWVAPAIAALIALPVLAKGLGAERFGIVALALYALTLFGVFDFGFARAVTRLVAEATARNDTRDIPDLIWTSAWSVLGISSVLAAIGVTLAPVLATRLLDIPDAMHDDAVAALRWLAVGIIPLTHAVVLRGVLEARQRFDLVNRLRVPVGVATYVGPLVALALGGGAALVVAFIVLGRTLYWLAHMPVLARQFPGLLRPRAFHAHTARRLFDAGGWIAISSVLGMGMLQIDRLVIAAMLPIAASGWYLPASELATRQLLFTAAIQPVLFSALSATLGNDRRRAVVLLERSTRVTMLVLFPVTLCLVLFAVPGLQAWMRAAYNPASAQSLRWLAIAIFASATAVAPYDALQSGLDVRAPALLQMLEIPLYVSALVLVVPRYGVSGAAVVSCTRMTLDAVAMWGMAAHRMPEARGAARQVAVRGALAIGTLLTIAWWVGRGA